MKLHRITNYPSFRAIRDKQQPGEIAFAGGAAFAREKYGITRWLNGVWFRESTWGLRDERRKEITEYIVTAMGYDEKTMLFALRQHARRLGAELCAEHGIRWRPG